MSGASGRAAPAQPPTKTIVVYRNGDAFYPGRKFVVNQRQTSTFDSFLSSVTRGVEAPFGAVRTVYTPREGHRVSDLEHLQHGERYVAAGAERFKKLDYFHITTNKPQKKKNKQIRPVVHSTLVVPARWGKIINESCTINVFTNGDLLVPPARILIPKYTLTKWESVLAMVTQRVSLLRGAVHRLCTLDGTPLRGPMDLENNQHYVAVGAEGFRSLPYERHRGPGKGVVRENDVLGQGVNCEGLPAIRKGRHASETFVHSVVGEDAARGQNQNQAGSRFYAARPQRAQQHRQATGTPLLFSTGEGSVFRARRRRRETAGACEVQEDAQVEAELPIDQVEAKVVEEESFERTYSRPASGAQMLPPGSEASSPPRPLSDASRKASSTAAESGRGTGVPSPRDAGPKTPLTAETTQETEEEEAPSKLCGVGLPRMSKFFRDRRKK